MHFFYWEFFFQIKHAQLLLVSIKHTGKCPLHKGKLNRLVIAVEKLLNLYHWSYCIQIDHHLRCLAKFLYSLDCSICESFPFYLFDQHPYTYQLVHHLYYFSGTFHVKNKIIFSLPFDSLHQKNKTILLTKPNIENLMLPSFSKRIAFGRSFLITVHMILEMPVCFPPHIGIPVKNSSDIFARINILVYFSPNMSFK